MKLKKIVKAHIAKLKPYWKEAKKAEDNYWKEISRIEEAMEKKFDVDYELFHCDGSLVGIGNHSRTISLLQEDMLK